MKKMFIAAIALTALLTSCTKAEKCKCSFELKSDILNLQLKDQVIAAPEDKTCAQVKLEDIKGDIVSIDLSKIGSIKCVNHYE